MAFQFTIEPGSGPDGPVSIRLSGRMTLGPHLLEFGRRVGSLPLPRGSQALLLDMSAVEDLDSAGLGELVILYTTVGAKGGRLGLVNPSPRIVHLLETTRLAGILAHFDSTAAAAAWLADPAKDGEP